MDRSPLPMATDMSFPTDGRRPQHRLRLEQPPWSTSQESHSGIQDCDCEFWHVNFRGFTPSEGSDPIQNLRTLSYLGHMWLRPDRHTKEEIMDLLVLEQFMVSMPEDLQALVKESGVKSCQALEDMLQRNRRPQKWSVIVSQGQTFLVRDSASQMTSSKAREMDDVIDLTNSDSKKHLKRGPISPQLQSLPGNGETSSYQEEDVLHVTISEKGDLDCLRPKQSSEKNQMEDGEEERAFPFPEPQRPEHPAGSVGEEEGETCTGITSSHVLEKEDSPGTCRYPQRSKRRRSDSTNMSQEGSQGGARYVEGGEFSRQVKVESGDPPRTVQPVERPGGQGAAGVASFGCGVCNKHFQYKSQFLVHQRTHTGERPFRCTSCQKGFMQPSDLRVHQRIHTGEKPYKCRVCHKAFTHESTLLAHRRVHTQEKPYECEDCKKRFSHRGNLNVHRRIHTNSRPYECPECGHAFRQLGTFKRHLKVHSGKTSG